MSGKVRGHLTYANVMATIAVFVALSGGAYAALKLPKNSVGTSQIKNKAVTPAKVASKTIALFKGQKGDPGQQGTQGVPGPAGPSNAYFNVVSPSPPQPTATASMSVPAGNYAISGMANLMAGGSGGNGSCTLTVNGNPLGADSETPPSGIDLATTQRGDVADQAVAHLAAAGTIANACSMTSGVVRTDTVTAIQVASASP